MQIQEERKGAVTVLRPMGPLAQGDVEQFTGRLEQVRDQSLGRFVVDMSASAFIDSKGLEALVDVHDELARSGQSLRVCGLNETLREVFNLTELSSLFESFEDVGAAVR